MTAELWQTLGTVAALLIVGGWNGWRSHCAERQAKEAATEAAVARQQTVSTGNGFAGDVLARLERMEAAATAAHVAASAAATTAQATHSLMVEHLADHAAHDLG